METRPRRRKPHIHTIHGPLPPRYPRHSRKRASQFVWPRDNNNGRWSRLKDIFKSQGPDIWCTRKGSLGPQRPTWSNWRSGQHIHPRYRWDNLGYYYENKEDGVHWVSAGRPDDVVYDFKQRKYCDPTPESWSDAKWSRNNKLMYHRTPLTGRELIEDPWKTPWRRNPFAYGEGSWNGWDWDEVPRL